MWFEPDVVRCPRRGEYYLGPAGTILYAGNDKYLTPEQIMLPTLNPKPVEPQPKTMICNHARECEIECNHKVKHDKLYICPEHCRHFPDAHCVPYVEPKSGPQPKMMICNHAWECNEKCGSEIKHAENDGCRTGCNPFPDAHCVPYVEPKAGPVNHASCKTCCYKADNGSFNIMSAICGNCSNYERLNPSNYTPAQPAPQPPIPATTTDAAMLGVRFGTERGEPTGSTFAIESIRTERIAQDLKWGEQNHSMEWWLAILMEEVGELAQAVLETHFDKNAEHLTKGGIVNIRKEAVQCAAVAMAMIECIDRARVLAEVEK
jgi:hypothetical protein